MGVRRHLQGEALAPWSLWKCCKVFCALAVTAKRSTNEVFMQ